MLLSLILSLLLPVATVAYELRPTTTISKVTLAGQRAELPCELPLPSDKPTLILWYKDQSTKPFYSYDARETDGLHKIHDNSDLATRSRFTLAPFQSSFKDQRRLGYLVVENVIPTDGGNFTCRVDFMTSQTMMALLQLTVHEDIEGLEVFDVRGNNVSKVIGPYKESTNVILFCKAYGGYPTPTVQWMSGDEILEPAALPPHTASATSPLSSRERTVSVMLHLPSLQRMDDGREIKCVAFNSDLTQPRSRVLTVEVLLPPLEVKIEGLDKPLLAGVETSLLCKSSGSKPPAKLTWKLEGSSGLTPMSPHSSLDQNVTLRRGRLIPTPDDNGRSLVCLATNPNVPEYKKESSKTLQIHFAPEVEAKLAPALNPDNIKEGEDVYFECLIRANPAETKVVWLHEGEQLFTNMEMGVLAQGKNLVLQKIRRQSRGKYQCRVTNAIDTATSSAASLDVMFAPECSGSKNVTVSVTPTEEVKLNCLVESNPPEVNFMWKVNSSRGIQDLEPQSYTSKGRSSTLVYRPNAHSIVNDQYGVVFCQGFNKIGSQKQPCMFIISPAGPPEELKSCTLKNQSATSLTVVCIPGFDGGLKQHFHATIQNNENGEIVANLSSETPTFSVVGLAPGKDYLVIVTAINPKGSSPAYHLEGLALKVAENKINNSSSASSSPLLAVFVGVVSGLSLVIMVLFAARRARNRSREEASDTASDSKASAVDEAPHQTSTNVSKEEQGNHDHSKDVSGGSDAQTPGSHSGSLRTPESRAQSVGSPGSLTSRTYVPYPTEGGQTGSLPRLHLQPRTQPLHSVDLPHMTSNNHKYYTLKINCTRQHNESFV